MWTLYVFRCRKNLFFVEQYFGYLGQLSAYDIQTSAEGQPIRVLRFVLC